MHLIKIESISFFLIFFIFSCVNLDEQPEPDSPKKSTYYSDVDEIDDSNVIEDEDTIHVTNANLNQTYFDIKNEEDYLFFSKNTTINQCFLKSENRSDLNVFLIDNFGCSNNEIDLDTLVIDEPDVFNDIYIDFKTEINQFAFSADQLRPYGKIKLVDKFSENVSYTLEFYNQGGKEYLGIKTQNGLSSPQLELGDNSTLVIEPTFDNIILKDKQTNKIIYKVKDAFKSFDKLIISVSEPSLWEIHEFIIYQ